MLICDMIKRNESDVGHVVFEILAKTVFTLIPLFYCFQQIDKFFITLDNQISNSPIIMGFASNEAF